MSLAALIGIDKERYDQGNKFLSQNPYLQNFQAKAPITFNESPMNTGITGPRIYPYPPIIPQGDGGDGGGGITPRGDPKFDYEFEALGGLYNPDNVPLTEEEQKTLNRQKNIDMLKGIGKFGLATLSPFGPFTTMGIGKGIGFIKDKFFGGDGDGGEGFDQDQYDAGKASAAAQAQANRDYARGDSDDGGSSGGQSDSQAGADAAQSASDEDAGAGGYAYGGRASFDDGLLADVTKTAEYKGWKRMYEMNPEIGKMHEQHNSFLKAYNTEQKAGGGIVGLFR